MKKLYSEDGWRRLTRARQRAEQKAKERRDKRLEVLRSSRPPPVPARASLRRANPSQGPLTIPAPEDFSFIDNTEELLQFFDKVERAMRRGRIPRLDMQSIRTIGPDASLVLTLVLRDLVARYRTEVRGVRPLDSGIEAVLSQSGFYEHVRVGVKAPPGPLHGRIVKRGSYHVEPVLASGLIKMATRDLFGTELRRPGTYRALIECMLNTVQHAAGSESAPKVDWWASVFCRGPEGALPARAQFGFVDNGVGIFSSVKLRSLQRLRRVLGLPDNPELLREIMEGKIGSRTGLSYRGKGLPTLYRLSKAGILEDLIIITNNVRARVGEGRFERLSHSFGGTFYYWQMGEQSHGKSLDSDRDRVL
jgi:hypothetical protein